MKPQDLSAPTNQDRAHSILPEGPASWRLTKAADLVLGPLGAWVTRTFPQLVELIEQETRARSQSNEVAVFAHPVIRFTVFLIALSVFWGLLYFTAAPRGILRALESYEHESIKEAQVCFGVGCLDDLKNPPEVKKLPFAAFRNLPEERNKNLFYRFKVERSGQSFKQGLDTVFFPMVWGEARIYANGVLVRSGMNVQPIIPLTDPLTTIDVHVLRTGHRTLGMGPLYAPFMIRAEAASEIEQELAGEPFQVRNAFIAQIAGFCLLLVMFLSFPYRPELFAFLVLFGVETLRSLFGSNWNLGRSTLSASVDSFFYSLLVVTGALAVCFFIGMFFRRELRAIGKIFKNMALWLAGFAFVGVVGFNTFLPRLSTENALFILSWLLCLVLSCSIALPSLVHLVAKRLRVRLLMGCATLAVVLLWGGLNIRDHLILDSQITTVGKNHLAFFFLMSVVLSIEIGRTEVKLKHLVAMVPRELAAILHKNESQWRQGFVILLDVVEWSDKLLLLSKEETENYIGAINRFILSGFEGCSQASIINDRGDGFFLTFEGSFTEEMFLSLHESCKKLAVGSLTCSDIGIKAEVLKELPVKVRSAIGYGEYKIGITQGRLLRRDYIAGFLPTLLARVIGNEKADIKPRILWSHPKLGQSPLDEFKGDRPLLTQQTKRQAIQYWEQS